MRIKYSGLVLSDAGFIPDDPSTKDEVLDILRYFVRCVDAEINMAPEMMKYIRDGVERYINGSKTPWAITRGTKVKRDHKRSAALIFSAHIQPNWDAHEGDGKRPSLEIVGKNANLNDRTDISKALNRAEIYLCNELDDESGEISSEIEKLAISKGFPDGKVVHENNRFYWITPEQEQLLSDEAISTREIIIRGLERADELKEQKPESLLEQLSIFAQINHDIRIERYRMAEIAFNDIDSKLLMDLGEVDSSPVAVRRVIDKYTDDLRRTIRKFFYCPRLK